MAKSYASTVIDAGSAGGSRSAAPRFMFIIRASAPVRARCAPHAAPAGHRPRDDPAQEFEALFVRSSAAAPRARKALTLATHHALFRRLA